MVTTASEAGISCFPPKPVVFLLTFPEIRHFSRKPTPRGGDFTVKQAPFETTRLLLPVVVYERIQSLNYAEAKSFRELVSGKAQVIPSGRR